MGKTMPKSTVIYGQQHAVRVASFTGTQLNEIVALVHDKVGPGVVVPKAAINKAIADAKNNKKMKDAYVKIGVIDGDLILRCKEKKFFGDIEIDVVLVKGYKPKASKYAIVKQEQEIAALEKAAAEREKEREKKEREERLRKVMNTPNEHGETLRERMLRAAEKGRKLGVGKGTQEDLQRQGLTVMAPQYHGEVLDHQKNRYGRNLNLLKAVWDQHSSDKLDFSRWLDEVEKKNTSAAGVAEALRVINPDTGKPLVEEGGIAGGQVIYLDANTRKPYEARVSKGAISGAQVQNGENIFVIGPDNKLYAGPKKRASGGVKGAFNHSSFFAGGPVKVAGTLQVAGGKITAVSNQSGHYAPTRDMIVTAVRKFGGGDQGWLDSVLVYIGRQSQSGTQFLNAANIAQAQATWGKYSHGTLHRDEAARRLMAAQDGAWLIRVGSDGSLVVTYRKGTTVDSVHAYLIGTLGLDRKQMLPPGQQPTTPTPTQAPAGLSPRLEAQLRQSPAFHANLNRAGSETLLKNRPEGSWLLRDGRGGIVAFSYIANGKPAHALIDSDEAYRNVNAHMRRQQALQVTA